MLDGLVSLGETLEFEESCWLAHLCCLLLPSGGDLGERSLVLVGYLDEFFTPCFPSRSAWPWPGAASVIGMACDEFLQLLVVGLAPVHGLVGRLARGRQHLFQGDLSRLQRFLKLPSSSRT